MAAPFHENVPYATASPGSPLSPFAPGAPGSPFGPCGPFEPCGPCGPAFPCSDLIAFFDRSFFWIVPSLICLVVMKDAATALPPIATTSAITATTMEPVGRNRAILDIRASCVGLLLRSGDGRSDTALRTTSFDMD